MSVTSILTPIWTAIGDPVAPSAPLHRFNWRAATWRSYGWALKLAVVYPIWAMLGVWLFGQEGQIGNVTFLEPVDFWPEREAE